MPPGFTGSVTASDGAKWDAGGRKREGTQRDTGNFLGRQGFGLGGLHPPYENWDDPKLVRRCLPDQIRRMVHAAV